ncbi:MAG TPA: hypothetical protein VGV09_00915 [Steroidobacteraceae bacterium]|nr:hypothetical protein [Steroidobacteraceae bacterium]
MVDDQTQPPANGSGAASLLAAGIGGCALGILALAGDASPGIARALNVWNPTGPLSGVTDLAIIVWVLSWLALSRLWAGRNLPLRRISIIAAALFLVGLLLTFPPFMDLLQGK